MLNMAQHSSYTIWVCAAVEICKILLVLHNILYVCGSMPQCPAGGGCPSSDCVAAIRASGQWTHPRLTRSWPDTRQKKN